MYPHNPQLYKERQALGLCGNCGLRPRLETNRKCIKCCPTFDEAKQRNIHKRFKISVEKYNRLLASQDGKCAICNENMIKPCLDHNHNTNQIRQFLCDRCNVTIGLVKEDTTILTLMIEYIKRHLV